MTGIVAVAGVAVVIVGGIIWLKYQKTRLRMRELELLAQRPGFDEKREHGASTALEAA